MEKYKNKHEIQAEINAREILLRQSQNAAIAHLECVVDAILAKSEPAYRAEVTALAASIEKLAPDVQAVVRLSSETDTGVKSKRQVWREELVELEEQLEGAPDSPNDDM